MKLSRLVVIIGILTLMGCGGSGSVSQKLFVPSPSKTVGKFSTESGGVPWIVGDFDLTIGDDLIMSGSGAFIGYPSVELSGTVTETGVATVTLTDTGASPIDPIVMYGQLYETATGGKGVLFHGASDTNPLGIPQDFELIIQ